MLTISVDKFVGIMGLGGETTIDYAAIDEARKTHEISVDTFINYTCTGVIWDMLKESLETRVKFFGTKQGVNNYTTFCKEDEGMTVREFRQYYRKNYGKYFVGQFIGLK